jgi:hypothetical protein
MNKRTMLYLSVVSILFSLVYTLFEYYGGVRYIGLRMSSDPSSYISKYPSIDRFDERRVVVVLDCTNCDTSNLLPTLLSLLDQTVRIDEIAICESPLSDKTPDSPRDNDAYPDIAVTYRTRDAISSTITRERDANTIILFLEPTVIYGKDFIERILSEQSQARSEALSKRSEARGEARSEEMDTDDEDDTRSVIKSKYCTCVTPNDVIVEQDGRVSFPSSESQVYYTENYKY